MQRWILLLMILLLTVQIAAQDEIPEPMPLVDEGDYDITNIMLLGSATYNGASNPGLTDTLMVVSINNDTGHVAVVSIPRDLYVYVPERGMYKINQTYFIAERNEAGTGVAVLRETLRHNLGLEIDYYARVDFSSFGSLIDSVGGVDVAVDCTIEDWRLTEPHLDNSNPDNWEMYTLWMGWRHMDGDLALWYVRSRRTSSDLDRTRRQQDVLRAVWRKIRRDGLLENFPQLWEQFNQIVETDMTLGDALGYVPLLLDLDAAEVNYYTFRLRHEVNNGYTPDEHQRFILAPNRDAIAELMQAVVRPPTSNRLTRTVPTVAIYNGSSIIGLEYVAAQRLEREGFLTTVLNDVVHPRRYNYIVDHTGDTRSNQLPTLQNVLRVTDEGVSIEPDAQRAYDYEIYIGFNYQFYACTFPVIQPSLDEDE